MSIIDVLRAPDSIRIETADGFLDGKIVDGVYNFEDIKIELLFTQYGMEAHLSAVRPISRVIFRFEQKIENISYLNDAFERAYANLMWHSTIIPEMAMPWYFIVQDKSTKASQGIGVMTTPNALCFWQMDSYGVTLMLDVRSGALGVELNGNTLNMATIISRDSKANENAYELYQKFATDMCERPILADFPVYGGNNWYYSYGFSTHQNIITDSKLMSELAPNKNNRPFMVIDSCWQQSESRCTCPGGPYERGNAYFPSMSGLANEMREIGVRPGIWMRPLLTSERMPDEMLLTYKRTTQTPFEGDVLDPTHKDSLELIHEDIKRIISWGYELIKHDFSTHDITSSMWSPISAHVSEVNGWGFYDRSKTTAEAIKMVYQTILDATGGKALIIGCNTVTHLTAGYAHIQRTGDDTSGRVWDRTRRMGVNALAFRMPQHKAFYLCDADCVGITENIPWELNKQWLELLSKSGTPLFISADPKVVTTKERDAIVEAFTLAAEDIPAGIPLDWENTTTPTRWLLQGKEETFNWNDEHGNILLSDQV